VAVPIDTPAERTVTVELASAVPAIDGLSTPTNTGVPDLESIVLMTGAAGAIVSMVREETVAMPLNVELVVLFPVASARDPVIVTGEVTATKPLSSVAAEVV